MSVTFPVEPEVEITQYRILPPIPAESVNRLDFAVYVERRRQGWAVLHAPSSTMGFGRDAQLGWDYPPPLFPLDEALAIAKRAAVTHRINGKNAAEVWEWEQHQ